MHMLQSGRLLRAQDAFQRCLSDSRAFLHLLIVLDQMSCCLTKQYGGSLTSLLAVTAGIRKGPRQAAAAVHSDGGCVLACYVFQWPEDALASEHN